MFERLFGPTEEDQLHYLKKRVAITVAFFIVDIILLITTGSMGISVLSCYMWGWGVMKVLFGFALVGSILGRNVVITAIFIVAYLLIGYLCGMAALLLGVGRYIYLEVKSRKVG